jgi:hypothetical protein
MNPHDIMNPDPLERTPPRADPFPIYPDEGESSAFDETQVNAGDQARQYAADLKRGSEEAFRSAKESGSSFVNEQKNKLASWLEDYYQAMESACDRMDSGDGNPLVEPAHRAASQLQRAATYLRSHQPGEFLDDLGSFARRRPELVYGGLFVVGLAAVRFMKASGRSRNESQRDWQAQQQTFGLANVPQDYGPAETYAPRPEPLPDLSPEGPPSAFEVANEKTTLP